MITINTRPDNTFLGKNNSLHFKIKWVKLHNFAYIGHQDEVFLIWACLSALYPSKTLTGYVAHAVRVCESQDVCGKWTSWNTIADNFLLMSWQKMECQTIRYQLQ